VPLGSFSFARGFRWIAPAFSTDQEHDGRDERNCFYCLSGWVFLGSLGHDGQEIYESVRCKRCDGTGVLTEATLR
jgi:hypothetical protein